MNRTVYCYKAWPRSPKSRSRSRSRSSSKIEIAIAIPIPIWKTICDPIAIAAPRSRDLLGDLFIYRLMETFVIMLKKCSDVWGNSALCNEASIAMPLSFLTLKTWKKLQIHCFGMNLFSVLFKLKIARSQDRDHQIGRSRSPCDHFLKWRSAIN